MRSNQSMFAVLSVHWVSSSTLFRFEYGLSVRTACTQPLSCALQSVHWYWRRYIPSHPTPNCSRRLSTKVGCVVSLRTASDGSVCCLQSPDFCGLENQVIHVKKCDNGKTRCTFEFAQKCFAPVLDRSLQPCCTTNLPNKNVTLCAFLAGALIYLLDLYCNAQNPAVREQTAELFAKILSDKLVGPKVPAGRV